MLNLKKKRVSPKYAVNLVLKSFDIAKAGAAVTVTVRGREGLIGTVEIGQGTFGWKAARTRRFKRFSWDTIASKLEEK